MTKKTFMILILLIGFSFYGQTEKGYPDRFTQLNDEPEMGFSADPTTAIEAEWIEQSRGKFPAEKCTTMFSRINYLPGWGSNAWIH